jgi:nucleotide-binding universal stress UspA family protein
VTSVANDFSTHVRGLGIKPINQWDYLKNAKTSAARHGIDFEEKIVTSTDTIKTITNFAKSCKFDIIVIEARGAGSPKSEFFGSVSNGILHGSRVPILVVK